MSEALEIRRCAACGHATFPPRVLCPRCGASRSRPEEAGEGTVEHVTTRSSGPGGGLVHLAAVRLDAGPVVIARCRGSAAPGGRVRLRWEAAGDGRRRVSAD